MARDPRGLGSDESKAIPLLYFLSRLILNLYFTFGDSAYPLPKPTPICLGICPEDLSLSNIHDPSCGGLATYFSGDVHAYRDLPPPDGAVLHDYVTKHIIREFWTRHPRERPSRRVQSIHSPRDHIQGTVMVTRVGIRRNCANRLIFAWTPSYLRLRTGPERWPEAYVLWSSTVGQGLSFREVTPYRDHPLLVYVRNAPPRSLRFR